MKNSLKVKRAMFNMTQQEFADRLGVSRQTINAIEKQKFNPSTLLALKMSELFHCPVNELFELEPSERP